MASGPVASIGIVTSVIQVSIDRVGDYVSRERCREVFVGGFVYFLVLPTYRGYRMVKIPPC